MALTISCVGSVRAQENTPQSISDMPQSGMVLKVNSDLVLTNVVVRNAKTGELVQGLKRSDFRVWENGREQQLSSFDFQTVEQATPLHEATVSGLRVVRRPWLWPSRKSCAIIG